MQSDIYSLGVLLYHLVTGDFPVRASTVDDLRSAHAKGAIVRLHDARPDMPDAFVQVVERAIEANPAARFASVGEMLAALRLDQVSRQPVPIRLIDRLKSRIQAMGALAVVAAAAIALFTIVGAAILFAHWQARAVGPVIVRSIAVIVDGKSEGESNVLAAGFAEGLTSTLGKIEALKVTQQSTASRYSETRSTDAAAGLRVDAVVRLQLRAGAPGDAGQDREVEVTAELYGPGNRSLGVESATSSIARLPQLQASMAAAIATRMRVPISSRDAQRLEHGRRSVKPDAYMEFLKGLQRAARRDQAGLKDAVGHFERAIHIDSKFALPYAALSEAYSMLRGNFGAYPAQLATDAAIGAASKAIELDDTLVYGWVSLGFARFYLEWNMKDAEQAFQRALELNPTDAMAHHHYGDFLDSVGRFEQGLEQRLLARERDPNSLIFSRGVAWNYFFMRRYADAARELEAIVAVDPENASVTSLLARTT